MIHIQLYFITKIIQACDLKYSFWTFRFFFKRNI